MKILKVDNWLARWLYPLHCQSCGLPTDAPLCAGCTADLPGVGPACPGCALPRQAPERCPACQRRPRAFDSATVPLRFEGEVREAVHALKYQARFEVLPWLVEALASAVRHRAAPLPDLLLPMPLHPGRLRWRGYNQAQLIADRLGQALALPVLRPGARRLRATADQIGQTAPERRRNLRGAFEVNASVRGRRIALVDDVMTTGASLEALAQAARSAGATEVEAWACGRTL